jgi:hypothetical protein
MKPGYKYLLLGTIAIVMLTVACSKGSTTTDDNGTGGNPHVDNPTDTTAPILDIYSPVANQVFVSGNVITVTGKITDDYGLYRGSIKIIDDASGAVLKVQAYEIHGIISYNFSISYTATVTTVSDYTVTVQFEDHGYNSTTRTVKIKVNP